ncbi:MAG: VapC toxin family PIN domain ribonuclease, partial [Actinomycetota bacterium]|nr:VapC toxin family PIN domain ribonuclease [Actinomycetota bacterium]
MSLYYVDTSALAGAYLPDEPGHRELRTTLLEGADPVVTSELTRLELVSAAQAAHRAGRIDDPAALLAVVDEDCQADGPITLLRLEPDPVLSEASALLVRFPL